jgi:hypothetical protein
MGRYYPAYITKHKEHSYARYDMRLKKDLCLYNDVEDFIATHNADLGELANRLLSGHFSHARYTDPEYPF